MKIGLAIKFFTHAMTKIVSEITQPITAIAKIPIVMIMCALAILLLTFADRRFISLVVL